MVVGIIVLQQTLLVTLELIKKTGKEIKLLIRRCSICSTKKSMTFSDNMIAAEGVGKFVKNLGIKRTQYVRKRWLKMF